MRRIAQETINRVLEEVDILDVISQYVDLKKRGKNYFGLSPFRSETKPSFSVAPDKNMWYDFGSGQGGNAVQFLVEYEKISFPEAVRSLAEKYSIGDFVNVKIIDCTSATLIGVALGYSKNN